MLGLCRHCVRECNYMAVWVNCFFIRDLRAPCGGGKDSGIGREGGTFSREFFTEPTAVVMQMARTAHRRVPIHN